MKQKLRFDFKSITVAAYVVTVVMFFVFVVYMFAFKDIGVYTARNIASHKIEDDYSIQVIDDSTAPVGIRKEYSWKMDNIDSNESCLMFYIVHSYAEVRFDGEIVYGLEQSKNTLIGKSPSSNWVVVPIYPSDVGKTVTVTVTPVYNSVVNREIVFKIGSRYSVFMQRLKADLPQIIIASLCIIMGILLIMVHLCFIANKRTSSFDMIYLGIFSLLLGIWRITDTRFSPVMFKQHTACLGYISLSAMFMMSVPMLLFIDERHTGKFSAMTRIVVLVNCVVSLFCLVCQVVGVADLRETLILCHITFIIDIAVLIAVCCIYAPKGDKQKNTTIFIVLLALGSIVDLVYYYIKDTSSGVVFTAVAFLIYTLYLFTKNILDINKKAYYDIHTKLYNKTFWEGFVKNSIPDSESIGVMMLDLNRLKYVNDTFGHKTGDKMILKFSDILRSTFVSGEFLCRWGGDEFVVVVRNADSEKMKKYSYDLHKAVEDYNKSGEKPEIYFACGYALSSEFPDVSRKELLNKADERMYIDKKQWYADNYTH